MNRLLLLSLAGRWNCIQFQVTNLASVRDTLRKAAFHFRNDIVTGTGVKQILLDDLWGNMIELFETLEQ